MFYLSMKTNKVENKMSTVRAGSEWKMSVLCCKSPFTLKKKSLLKMFGIFPYIKDKIIEIQAMGKARENYLQKYPIHLSMYIFLIAAQFEARAIFYY